MTRSPRSFAGATASRARRRAYRQIGRSSSTSGCAFTLAALAAVLVVSVVLAT